MGYNLGSTGAATISGTGSQWTDGLLLYVGRYGSGRLHVEAGGRVSNKYSYLGYFRGSTGEATITGIGSQWTNSGSLVVGPYGSGSLSITNGGLVSVAGTLVIGLGTDGDSFVNMATGGMLALKGDADESLVKFLDLVTGTDAIRYWDKSLADSAPITAATEGVDYALDYLTEGELTGYTLLTVAQCLSRRRGRC